MVTVIYKNPIYKEDDLYIIGWSKTQFEKSKMWLFHRGNKESAQEKINSMPGKKYIPRPDAA